LPGGRPECCGQLSEVNLLLHNSHHPLELLEDTTFVNSFKLSLVDSAAVFNTALEIALIEQRRHRHSNTRLLYYSKILFAVDSFREK
jgi:hypothetical protein